MKERIINAINEDPSIEPIVLLSSNYKQLTDKNQKKEFLSVLKDLVISGSEKERFSALTIIEYIGEAKENEDLIKNIVSKISFDKDEKIIPSLLSLCTMLRKDWWINFIKKIIEHFKPTTKKYSYYFDIGLRNIISTDHWRDSIGDIEWVIANNNDVEVVDFIAYFLWQQGRCSLVELIRDANIKKRIVSLSSEIIGRYSNNYTRINFFEVI